LAILDRALVYRIRWRNAIDFVHKRSTIAPKPVQFYECLLDTFRLGTSQVVQARNTLYANSQVSELLAAAPGSGVTPTPFTFCPDVPCPPPPADHATSPIPFLLANNHACGGDFPRPAGPCPFWLGPPTYPCVKCVGVPPLFSCVPSHRPTATAPAARTTMAPADTTFFALRMAWPLRPTFVPASVAGKEPSSCGLRCARDAHLGAGRRADTCRPARTGACGMVVLSSFTISSETESGFPAPRSRG
jgi:hypothetical protein